MPAKNPESSSARLEFLAWNQGVAGSNPASQTIQRVDGGNGRRTPIQRGLLGVRTPLDRQARLGKWQSRPPYRRKSPSSSLWLGTSFAVRPLNSDRRRVPALHAGSRRFDAYRGYQHYMNIVCSASRRRVSPATTLPLSLFHFGNSACAPG